MEISKQYVAGFIDGEAFIGIKLRPKFNYWVRYRIQINQKSREVLDMIQNKYGGRIELMKKKNPCFRLNIRKKKNLIVLLKDIIPYLIVKKKEAKQVMLYLKTGDKSFIKEELSKPSSKVGDGSINNGGS